MASTQELSVKITGDSSDLQKAAGDANDSLQDLQDNIQQIDREQIEIKPEIDKLQIDRDIATLNLALDRIERRKVDPEADLDITQLLRDERRVRAELALLDAQKVDITVDIDKDRLGVADLERIPGILGSIATKVRAIPAPVALLGLAAALPLIEPIALATGLGIVGAVAAKVATPFLQLADQMANAKIAFTQFLGSTKDANAFLADLEDFSAKTPFEFPQLIEASKTLLAFGIDAGDVTDLLTTMGDTAALTGADVGSLTTIWGQMKAKGKVGNEELLQLTEAGVPAFDLLAEKLGISVAKVQDLATKGKLLSDNVLPKLQSALNEEFGGGMAKEAETLSGKWSTLKDTLSGFGREVGAAMTPIANTIADAVQPALEDLGQWAKEHKGDIANALSEGVAAFLDVAGVMIGSLGDIVNVVGQVAGAVGGFIKVIGEGMQHLQGIPGIPDDFGDSVVEAGQNIQDFGDDAKGVADKMFDMGQAAHDAADSMRAKGKEMQESFRGDELHAQLSRWQGDLADLKKQPPTPKVEADISEAEGNIRRLHADLRTFNQSKTVAKIDTDIHDAQSKAQQIRAALRNLERKPSTPQIRADIREWKGKLAVVHGDIKSLTAKRDAVKVDVQLPTARQMGQPLDDLAGHPRTASINVEDKGTSDAGSAIDKAAKDRDSQINVTAPAIGGISADLDNAARDRDTTITVNYEFTGTGQPSTGSFVTPPAVGPHSLVPNLLTTPSDLLGPAARLSTPVQPSMMASPFNPQGGLGAQPQVAGVTQLAPRQVPVKVYLDGEEIANKLAFRVARNLPQSSLRRRA